MDRRKFLGIASFAGLAAASQGVFSGTARAAAGSLLGGPRRPLLLTINAGGGWDPTSLCDPKGGPINRSFRARDIVTTASGIRHAPLGSPEHPDYFRYFFKKYDRKLLVINGVDTGTRGHASGARHTWSGRLDEGAPSFAALVAAAHGRDLGLPYLSFGGHDETMGEVVRTRGGDGEADRLANPDRVDPSAGPTLFEPQSDGGLLFAPHTAVDDVRRLQRHLPALDSGDNPLIRQIQVAMAAYRAGLTVAVNLELQGFDTHEDHDRDHIPRLVQLLQGLDFIGDEADRQRIGDDYVVVVGSEFGRTPGYNARGGKDHGPITSMMAMGRGVAGGRVVGATDDRHAPVGPRITPAHVHRGLRRLAGLDRDALARRYPLAGADDLDLFAAPRDADLRPAVA